MTEKRKPTYDLTAFKAAFDDVDKLPLPARMVLRADPAAGHFQKIRNDAVQPDCPTFWANPLFSRRQGHVIHILPNSMIPVGGHRLVKVRSQHGLDRRHNFSTSKTQRRCGSHRRARDVERSGHFM